MFSLCTPQVDFHWWSSHFHGAMRVIYHVFAFAASVLILLSSNFHMYQGLEGIWSPSFSFFLCGSCRDPAHAPEMGASSRWRFCLPTTLSPLPHLVTPITRSKSYRSLLYCLSGWSFPASLPRYDVTLLSNYSPSWWLEPRMFRAVSVIHAAHDNVKTLMLTDIIPMLVALLCS